MVVLGIGMAISVAPLTTAVMESVPSREAGVASGVNNAVSRIAGLLAIAVFGLVLSAGFNRTLSRSLAQMQLSPSVRQSAETQRSKLAGAQISDLLVKHAFEEAFVSGYREVIWISVGLALLSALSAQMIQSKQAPCERQQLVTEPCHYGRKSRARKTVLELPRQEAVVNVRSGIYGFS